MDEKMVVRYIGGMWQNFQDTLYMFDFFSVLLAYAKASLYEKQGDKRGRFSWNFGNA